MKFFTLLASVLLLFFTTILILGVILGSEFTIKRTISIEAPSVVVYKELTEFDHYAQWCPNIKTSRFHSENKSRTTVYKFGDKQLQIRESVQSIENQNLVIFIQDDSLNQSYIQNFTNEIKTSENPDGTTEVEWKTTYNIKPVLSKFLNRLFLMPTIEDNLSKNLEALKRQIEG